MQVFSTGSYGSTSIAQAIANRCTGNVLILDFDTVSPKLETYYKLAPVCKELVEIPMEMRRTGLGALVEKGSDYVIDNIEKIVKKQVRSDRSIRNTVDYFSGSYKKLDAYKLMAVNFDEFFTYLGNCYDYIVIDSGKIGHSEINDAIIRMINQICYRNIVVTLPNVGDARVMNALLKDNGIFGKKTVWVLNMIKSNYKMFKLVKECIGYADSYYEMHFEKDVFCETVDLDKSVVGYDIKGLMKVILGKK